MWDVKGPRPSQYIKLYCSRSIYFVLYGYTQSYKSIIDLSLSFIVVFSTKLLQYKTNILGKSGLLRLPSLSFIQLSTVRRKKVSTQRIGIFQGPIKYSKRWDDCFRKGNAKKQRGNRGKIITQILKMPEYIKATYQYESWKVVVKRSFYEDDIYEESKLETFHHPQPIN